MRRYTESLPGTAKRLCCKDLDGMESPSEAVQSLLASDTRPDCIVGSHSCSSRNFGPDFFRRSARDGDGVRAEQPGAALAPPGGLDKLALHEAAIPA
jgi:hypothetical protein